MRKLETANERETFYDTDVAPAILAIARQCEERGLSFLTIIVWDPGEFGRTVSLCEGSGISIRLAYMVARAKGNVDAIIIALMKYGSEHGHNSICLSQLGVPTSPESKSP